MTAIVTKVSVFYCSIKNMAENNRLFYSIIGIRINVTYPYIPAKPPDNTCVQIKIANYAKWLA